MVSTLQNKADAGFHRYMYSEENIFNIINLINNHIHQKTSDFFFCVAWGQEHFLVVESWDTLETSEFRPWGLIDFQFLPILLWGTLAAINIYHLGVVYRTQAHEHGDFGDGFYRVYHITTYNIHIAMTWIRIKRPVQDWDHHYFRGIEHAWNEREPPRLTFQDQGYLQHTLGPQGPPNSSYRAIAMPPLSKIKALPGIWTSK